MLGSPAGNPAAVIQWIPAKKLMKSNSTARAAFSIGIGIKCAVLGYSYPRLRPILIKLPWFGSIATAR